MKKPEEYLEEHVVVPEERANQQMSSVEQDFIKKYLTGEEEIKLTDEVDTELSFHHLEAKKDNREEEANREVKEETEQENKTEDSETAQEETDLKSQEKIQLVGFYLQNQEYTIPISDVKEVIKKVEPTEIPESPEYLLGVVNLKGKLTPLINLAHLLEKNEFDANKCGFIIVGRYQDLQVGVLVDRITTMYNIEQKDIDWTLDPYLTGGGDKGFLIGLIRGDPLIGIVSVKEIIDKIVH